MERLGLASNELTSLTNQPPHAIFMPIRPPGGRRGRCFRGGGNKWLADCAKSHAIMFLTYRHIRGQRATSARGDQYICFAYHLRTTATPVKTMSLVFYYIRLGNGSFPRSLTVQTVGPSSVWHSFRSWSICARLVRSYLSACHLERWVHDSRGLLSGSGAQNVHRRAAASFSPSSMYTLALALHISK